jgi:hypothetical protein
MLKYPKIKNHTDKNLINQWLLKLPNLLDIDYIGQLKYDGSNVSIEFKKNQDFKIFTRNNRLGGNGDFMGFREILSKPKYQVFLNKIQAWLDIHNILQSINLFGELYGPGVQKRINYGKERAIKFFDVYFDSKLQSVAELNNLFKQLDALDFLVEILLKDVCFKEMINLAEKISNSTDIEGFVIKPLNYVFLDNENLPFYIKVKSKKFMDIDKNLIDDKELKTNTIELQNTDKESDTNTVLNNILSCLNQNRILDCRSKIIWLNFEDFAKFVLDDVLTDCDLTDKELSKECVRIIYGKINQISKKLFNLKSGELI